MTNRNDYNRQVIEEFRANGGKVSGPFEHTPLLLLTTTGAKSGARRITPMEYIPDGDRLLVFASRKSPSRSGPRPSTPSLLSQKIQSGIGCGPRQWNGIPFSPSTRRRQPASFR